MTGSGDATAQLLVAIKPSTSKSQRRVADVIVYLLRTGKKGDFNVAVKTIDALGSQHRSADRVKAAFVEAADVHGFRVPPKAVDALGRANIRLPKKSLTESAWKAFKDVFRR